MRSNGNSNDLISAILRLVIRPSVNRACKLQDSAIPGETCLGSYTKFSGKSRMFFLVLERDPNQYFQASGQKGLNVRSIDGGLSSCENFAPCWLR